MLLHNSIPSHKKVIKQNLCEQILQLTNRTQKNIKRNKLFVYSRYSQLYIAQNLQ